MKFNLVARAAEAANIDDISQQYPKDEKQRNATHWKGFVAALNVIEQELVQQFTALLEDKASLANSKSDVSSELAKREGSLRKLEGRNHRMEADLFLEKLGTDVVDRNDRKKLLSRIAD